jgi:DNA (cytosine-5)-methyltransferase 1
MKFGSVCSGIEAASLAFKPIGMHPVWFSEIADFPSKVLKHHHPDIPNLGDMNDIPEKIRNGLVEAPDILCGGTPCQAFSLAGWQQGLVDSRGQLTLKFIEVADAIDDVRLAKGQKRSIVLWENVEGVLRDRTNAFGAFLAGLAGLHEEIKVNRWASAGILVGPKRKIAWRILDAKYFGLPQQRKRLFVIATDPLLNPEIILFEKLANDSQKFNNIERLYKNKPLAEKQKILPSFIENDLTKETNRTKYFEDTKIQVFRSYTDCLYSAYGTKWNGNAAAYNGSLYIAQNDKVRRLTPLECERLMGFPDNYTALPSATDTTRYQAIGNSWAIPVVEWIGERIYKYSHIETETLWLDKTIPTLLSSEYSLYFFNDDLIKIGANEFINVSTAKNNPKKGEIFDIIHIEAPSKFYISSKASYGILRRKNEKNLKMNEDLEKLFVRNSETYIQYESILEKNYIYLSSN